MIRWWQFLRRARCPHSDLRGIYGDEIVFGTPRWNRIQCRDCGKFLDGPVGIVLARSGEPAAVERWLAGRRLRVATPAQPVPDEGGKP